MKQLMAGFLSLVMLLTLCGCGKKDGGSTWQEQYDLGVRYLSEGNYEEAIIAFTAVIEIDPKNIDSFLGRASAYIGSGETEENLTAALVDYQSVVELDDTRADAYLGMADVYIRQGEYENAIEILKIGLEKTKDSQSIADKLSELESGNISDSSGKVRCMSTYGTNGDLIWYHAYTYDEQGRVSSVTSYDNSGAQTGRVDISYNTYDEPTADIRYSNETGEVTKTEYEYDTSGRKSRALFYAIDGKLDYYDIYQYDNQGRLIREDEYGQDGKQWGYQLIFYNEIQGGWARRESYSSDGELLYYTTRSFHENGKVDITCVYHSDGTLGERTVFLYDNEWNLIGDNTYSSEENLITSTTYN